MYLSTYFIDIPFIKTQQIQYFSKDITQIQCQDYKRVKIQQNRYQNIPDTKLTIPHQ